MWSIERREQKSLYLREVHACVRSETDTMDDLTDQEKASSRWQQSIDEKQDSHHLVMKLRDFSRTFKDVF